MSWSAGTYTAIRCGITGDLANTILLGTEYRQLEHDGQYPEIRRGAGHVPDLDGRRRQYVDGGERIPLTDAFATATESSSVT
ncbi:MAG: hypothetical protein ACLT38_04735 [Akkermansia sp.]